MDKKTFEQTAEENMNLWLKFLKKKDIESMVEMYTEPCLFLPTFSDEIITDRKGVKDYFEHFMAKDPEGELVSEDGGKKLTDSIYVSGAKYNFNIPDGVVNARYDMTWVKENGKWMISVHHSSLLPKPEGH